MQTKSYSKQGEWGKPKIQVRACLNPTSWFPSPLSLVNAIPTLSLVFNSPTTMGELIQSLDKGTSLTKERGR
jgi:hypothetical protein